MSRIAHILLTLWAGGLWTICGFVAPTLFAVLGRETAGQVVGRFFSVAAWAGLLIGAVLIALTRTPIWAAHRSLTVLIATSAAAPIVSELVLGPLMHQARLAGEMGRFALWHGLGSVLFAIACLGTLAIVWKVNRAE
jgi:hypothetical protein